MMDSGLEGLVVAETVLSHSDGSQDILWVRGHTLAELVARFGYEGAVGLLWEEFATEAGFAERPDLDAIQTRLGAAREDAFASLGDWLDGAASRPVLEGVRIALAHLPDAADPATILATLPVAIGALLRRRRGETPLPPDPALGTAADIAPSPARCTVARRGRLSTCSTRPRRAAMSSPGPKRNSPPASG